MAFITVYVTKIVSEVSEHAIEVPADLDYENPEAVRKYAEETGQLDNPLTIQSQDTVEIDSVDNYVNE